MEGVLFVTALLTYVGTYTLSLHFARALLGRGPDALTPRLIALIALALATLAFAVWAQVTLVDSTLLAAPDPVAHGRYGERVRLLSVAPAAAVAVGALLFGWRSRRAHAKARTLRERSAA
ncbi:hypothetical protein LVB77_08305 [Lysobacter sp. 5GHs7-4]|uniref:hypothetical protein n=1 Tax=Lysobacter sp. 5GHs7-4 TaxID=2904253 RepID=UPI001E2EEC20|nr:hypothetical protein [Lysobacter sp. 5GHs7-4]UHQ24677.1 hypothetical protein LVB77_08305 [Lysobacter sp. 5GHs7-4]